MQASELSPTGKVILGMIASGVSTGYDIKQFVDKTTRHFHAASYGQIYPELRRLEDRGFVVGTAEPSGARARTVYSLTDAGRDALEAWLCSDAETTYEVRDEGMLKLFFSDSLPERRLANLRAMRERNQHKLDQLRALEPMAAAGPLGHRLTLELGIGLHEWLVNWSLDAERRLAAGEGSED
jgi:DNA-binding PadR family transcriptional regulator